MNTHVAVAAEERRTTDWRPFRPVQYLGSKLRVLGEIRSAAATLVKPGTPVADLFTGSTVVAQCLASTGAKVAAIDTQLYAQQFGTALLGVGRVAGEAIDGDKVVDLAQIFGECRASGAWRAEQEAEADALDRQDAVELRRLYDTLPLAWRAGSSSDHANSVTSVYAGTYFGVRQAREIDFLRSAIAEMAKDGSLSAWQRAAAMTALMHAASLAVHSAGKHFAQPLRDGSGNSAFLNTRLLSDRSISIADRFMDGCRRVTLVPFTGGSGHSALRVSAEDHVVDQNARYGLYYLDPPYTAQQYSRFYHVLETLADDGVPKLPFGEPVSSGLYPAGRYKSAFSSKRAAAKTMARVLEEISRRGAAALISYSASATGSNGNARMVSLEELLAICSRAFGTTRVECSTMAHRYRQFNSAGNANDKRDDSEILILCKSA